MNKSAIAREYRRKYPDMPTAKLARIMYSKEKLIFNSAEDARDALRYIEGKRGTKKHRQYAKHIAPDLIMAEARTTNPYKLPDSDETSYEPYILKGHKKIAIFSDIHAPYHSIEAITAALMHAKKEKVDGLILNGDTIDCHLLSRFEKDPRRKPFAKELDIFKQMIEVFEESLGCQVYYKIGNHEERYEHFLMQKAGELVGVEEFELENIIKSRTPKVKVIKDKRIIHAGALSIIHGHEFGQGFFSPVNVARGLALRAKTSAIQGHNHQVSEHTEVDLNGKIMTTWSVGCLCELHPKYLPINKWAHGFAIVELNGKDFHVKNYRINKGKIL